MSRSVIIPTSLSSSTIGSEPMSSSRINRAASTTDADAPIERGSSVIASRMLCAIVSPLLFRCDLTPWAEDLSESDAKSVRRFPAVFGPVAPISCPSEDAESERSARGGVKKPHRSGAFALYVASSTTSCRGRGSPAHRSIDCRPLDGAVRSKRHGSLKGGRRRRYEKESTGCLRSLGSLDADRRGARAAGRGLEDDLFGPAARPR